MGRPGVVVAVLVGLLAGFAPAAQAAPAELRSSGQRFVDAHGREVVLRGGALIEKFGDGLPELDEADWANLRALGWNHLRLGTAWEFIEPRRGDYDEAYLDRFAALAREAMSRGLHVIVDLHQDVWGKPAGNGAPAWATYPECAGRHVDLASAAGTFAANYFSPFTVCQFTRFWTDPALQDRYAAALGEVARRIGGQSLLAGWDLMNEPYQGALAPGAFEAAFLFPFYARVTRAIRRHDPDGVVFLEPANSKNVHLPTASPLGTAPANAAYAPHVYGLWDANDAFTQREALVAANVALSVAEAKLARLPLWFGEFGMRRSAPRAEATLTQIYELADRHRAGAAVWEYASNDYGPLRADGTLEPARSRTVARPYPDRTAGTLRSFGFDGRTFTMRWRATAGETVVALPPLRFAGGYDVTLDAGSAVREAGRLVVRAPAGERTLTVTAR